MPIISVIIPVYNGEKTILETINAVLNQAFQDFEIIVINDGSQDSTLEIVSNIPDSRIKTFSYPNSGAPASRNRGFAHSTGEYIAFLDADDLWTPDKLEAQFQALQAHPEAAVAYSWTDYIDEFGKLVQPGRHITANGDVYPLLLVNNFLENGSNPLIQRRALDKIGGFDESLLGGQDWDLYIRLAVHYHFVAVPAAQVLYRVSQKSISSQLKRQENQCLQVLERAFAQAPLSLQPLKKKSLANLYKYLVWKSLSASKTSHLAGIQSMQFLGKYMINEPEAFKEWKFISIMFVKLTLKAFS